MSHTLCIEKIISDGKGLARPDNSKVIMVPGVLPGEVVKVSPVKEFRGYILAQVDEIITASPFRRKPVCPWYSDCGGCDLQHCSYEAQLEIKSAIVQEAMERASVLSEKHCLIPPLPSPRQFGYRDRIRLHIGADGQIGFLKHKSHKRVTIEHCAVAAAEINTVLHYLQSSRILASVATQCREVELLVSPATRRLTLLLAGSRKNIDLSILDQLTEHKEIWQAGCLINGKIISRKPLHPLEEQFSEVPAREFNGYNISWGAECFSQVNGLQNRQLVKLVCTLAGNVNNSSLVELFCGAGNFSIPLGLQGAYVTGIELNKKSIQWAKSNALMAGVNAIFFATDVVNSLNELIRRKQKTDTLLLDPPRRGLGKTAELTTQLNARQIIYISCDPATLARDLAVICSRNYSLTNLVPVDMFPQTHHVETVALLKRN